MGNSSVKLIFPSHGMPYVIPYDSSSTISAKIDELIKDMEGESSSSQQPRRLKLPKAGLELDCPKPGDWTLIDVNNASIIHRTVAANLITEGGTYMVLPNHASRISKEGLKEAIQVIKLPYRDENDDNERPPGYNAVRKG